MNLISVQTDSYNTRHMHLSPQKKPLAGSLLKDKNIRPNSAMKLKYEPDQSVQSPIRGDSKTTKKLSMSRYPTASAQVKPYDSRLYANRKKNEEDISPHLSKSSAKWDRQLSIDTNESSGNHSGMALKGFSVSHSASHAHSKTISQTNTSKFFLYNTVTPPTGSYAYHNRGMTPPSHQITSLKKNASGKTYLMSSNATSPGHNEKLYKSETIYKEESNSSIGLNGGNITKSLQYDDDDIGLPPFEPTKCSIKQNGVIKAYAVNTHQGIVRNYNEDRVAIILNIMRPAHVSPTEDWPSCSFFGVYDGHGGTACADFLRDNLHQFVIQDKNFPKNPAEALRRGFEEAERSFREIAQMPTRPEIDRSGSCAIVALIVEDMCYIANVGDSRVAASFEAGTKVFPLSRDHKPSDRDEQKRIVSFGGKIYQSQITQPPGFPGPKIILGPHRVFPGRLSVSRTFGDIEAKLPKYGGNPYVVVAEPEIKAYRVTKDWDFIVLASDGIYDKMENSDVARCIWDSTMIKESDVHKQSAVAVERLMKESLIQKTLDNITVVMVCFEGFERKIFGTGASEDTKKLELEKSPPMPLQRSLLPNSLEKSSHSSTPSHKSYLNNSNDRQSFSSMSLKKYENSLTSSFDLTGLGQLDRLNGGLWKAKN